MEEKRRRIEELVKLLNEASRSYYGGSGEVMSDFEWDAMFDELAALEQETGITLPDSPTQNVGAAIASSQKREAHEYPALSLKKSKDVEDIQKWAGNYAIWLSWKLDGITLVATYDKGELSKLMTRGNGRVGAVITYLAPYIQGMPLKVEEKGHLVVRGEAVISYSDFGELNASLDEDADQYANPRNLVAGTLALDVTRAKEVGERKVRFVPFTLVHTDREIASWGERMDYLKELGFIPVDRERTDAQELPALIERWTLRVQKGFDYPVDGLVVTFDDVAHAATGSVTGHHATNAGMAFKWQDVSAETRLDHVEWSCAASTISPVAVFDMVELEGTQVRRASLCNISEMRRLGIGEDGKTDLTVIKSNMIIPKVVKADGHGTGFEIPKVCPVCHAPTKIHVSEGTGTETLHCTNPDCTAKQIQKFTRFVSKSGMDIDGLSTRTIVKFINAGFLSDFSDIYRIASHGEEIKEMEGMGEKSYENLLRSVENSKHRELSAFLFALCIPLIGLDAGKRMVSTYGTSGFLKAWEAGEDFSAVGGIGPEKAGSLASWLAEEKNRKLLDDLLSFVSLKEEAPKEKGGSMDGLTFVITGDVHLFKNRKEFTQYVESQNGKVTGSVSKKTSFLVNNDANSTSSKNKKAAELGIPILTEEQFVDRFGRP